MRVFQLWIGGRYFNLRCPMCLAWLPGTLAGLVELHPLWGAPC